MAYADQLRITRLVRGIKQIGVYLYSYNNWAREPVEAVTIAICPDNEMPHTEAPDPIFGQTPAQLHEQIVQQYLADGFIIESDD